MRSRVDKAERQTYYGEGAQPWDDIVRAGFGAAFAAGSILKYLRRQKGEREKDVEKARWYWTRLVALSIGEPEDPGDEIDRAHLALAWLGQTLKPEETALLTAAP